MIRTLSVLLALGAGLVLLTAFQGGGCAGHRDPARMERMLANHLDDVLDDLDATDAQRQQIRAIKDDLVAKARGIHAAQPNLRRELVAQWDAQSPDMTKVHALVDQRLASVKAFADEVADAAGKLHAILTPEQRAKISKKLHRRMGE